MNPPGGPGTAVYMTVPPGASSAQVGQLLASHRVILSPGLFRWYLRFHTPVSFRAGTYAAHLHESYVAAIRDLTGTELTARLTIPEGFTLQQVADRVGRLPGRSSTRFLALAKSGQVRSRYEPSGVDNLEGLLFPATYAVTPDEPDLQILSQMVGAFDERAAAMGLDNAPADVGVSPYQALVVASLVEREAKLDPDRGLVAEVVYNRLAKAMKLQIDATVIYALGGHVSVVTNADLQVSSPYNTYRVTGLPPTPIASPGLPSLEAALHPPAGKFLYYVVVKADGTEAFSSTFAGQEANIALARSRGLG
jgi:UPF0755 protein